MLDLKTLYGKMESKRTRIEDVVKDKRSRNSQEAFSTVLAPNN